MDYSLVKYSRDGARMNLNELAKEICKREGKKKQVDIAQVKEVLRVLMDIIQTPGPKSMKVDPDGMWTLIYENPVKPKRKAKKK